MREVDIAFVTTQGLVYKSRLGLHKWNAANGGGSMDKGGGGGMGVYCL